MSRERWSVECQLGLEGFDDRRAGVAAARAVAAEVRRRGRSDRRVREVRWHRRGPDAVELRLVLEARSSREAGVLGAELVRAGLDSVQGVGGPCPSGLRGAGPTTTPVRRRRRRRPELPPLPTVPSWAEVSAAARQQAARRPSLPPLQVPLPTGVVLDLR